MGLDDISVLNAQELRARAGEKLTLILEVAKKSGNLKGEFVSRLKKSAATLGEVVEALASRSEAEETRRLRADNNRLRLDVESMKAEIKALRRGFTEAKTAAAVAANAAAAATATTTAGTAAPYTYQFDSDQIEELKRSLTITYGQMLDARLAVVEERLPPAPIVRPPLRADAKKTAAAATTPKLVPEPTCSSASKTGKAQKPFKNGAQNNTTPPAPTEDPSASGKNRDASQGATQEETWTKVVRKRKGKRQNNSSVPSAMPTTSSTNRVSAKARPSAPASNKARKLLRSPKSAAVVLSLQPDAADKGVSYSDVVKVAQEKISLEELGIDQLRFRQTATGARMLEISGSQNSEKADQLAEKLRSVLSGVANIARPIKCTSLRVTGLDDAATKENKASAVASAGSCDLQLVKVGEIHTGFNGTGSVLVSCPVSAAKLLSEKGRILVG